MPRIEVTPPRALAGVRVGLRLHGFEPGQRVTVRARMHDDLDRLWLSHATFRAGLGGVVDLAEQAPIEGTYSGVDAMGLVWSMSLDPSEGELSRFMKRGLNPILITFTAEVDYEPLASATLERLYIAPGVTSTPVRDNRLVATYYRPAEAAGEPRMGVVVLGGADGGMYEGVASRLASHGFPSLSLAYFGMEHLSPQLRSVPLEYFKGAISWLDRQPEVASVALVGWSRGAEAALLAGAAFPQVRAVVGYVPSAFVGPSSTLGVPDLDGLHPAWSHGGRPLPFLSLAPTPEVGERLAAGGPASLRPLFEEALAREPHPRAVIPVEKINGPVLLISGEDDALWPSPLFARILMERLEESEHGHEHLHLNYERAGHTIGVPYRPTTVTQHRTPSGVLLEYGGTAPGNAYAEADSWPRVIELLGRG